jgi:hypothetical protein
MCIKLVIKTNLYYDARSEKHQILLGGYRFQNPPSRTVTWIEVLLCFDLFTLYFFSFHHLLPANSTKYTLRVYSRLNSYLILFHMLNEHTDRNQRCQQLSK